MQDLFPRDLYKPNIVPYDPLKDPQNPRRCIFAPAKDENGKPIQSADEYTFFSNMSRAMALHCSGVADVINVNAVDLNGGIWANVEYPTLKADGIPRKVWQVRVMSSLLG